MLECFSFLEDKDLINEIVITNTNMIADQIDKILPVPNDHLYTPTIETIKYTIIGIISKDWIKSLL